jgi:hypothetical protein
MTTPTHTILEAFERGRQGEAYRGLGEPTFQTQAYVAHAVGAFLRENDCDPDAAITNVVGYAITVESFSGAWTYRMDAQGALQWAEADA